MLLQPDKWIKFINKYGQASGNLEAATQAIEQAESFLTQLIQQQQSNTLSADKHQLYTQLSQMAFDLQSQVLPTIQSDVSPQGKVLAKQGLVTYNRLMQWIKNINKPSQSAVSTTNVAETVEKLFKKYGQVVPGAEVGPQQQPDPYYQRHNRPQQHRKQRPHQQHRPQQPAQQPGQLGGIAQQVLAQAAPILQYIQQAKNQIPPAQIAALQQQLTGLVNMLQSAPNWAQMANDPNVKNLLSTVQYLSQLAQKAVPRTRANR